MDTRKIEEGVRLILEGVGEDPDREGLRETPARVARMYEEVFAGLDAGSVRPLRDDLRRALQRDGPRARHSLLLDVRASSGALLRQGACRRTSPRRTAASADCRSSRASWTCSRSVPQVQERLTSQIADTLVEQLHPQGVIVVLEAEHHVHEHARREEGRREARTVTSARARRCSREVGHAATVAPAASAQRPADCRLLSLARALARRSARRRRAARIHRGSMMEPSQNTDERCQP